MACTIVSTPATGAADWTGWITQQGLTDRGFMRVSLTEFVTTAASLIGTGSVFELAGSIYSCSDAVAIGLATGTASAAVAVYYVAIPSAGGTVCTFVMDDNVPTWIDVKQGYYASAASTSRYLGGAYIGTAATYYDKWLFGFGGDSIIKVFSGAKAEFTGGTRTIYDTTQPFLLKKIIELGNWDMDAATSLTITHGLDMTKIRGLSGTIRNDANNRYFAIPSQNVAGEVDVGFKSLNSGGIGITSANVSLFRAEGSDFNDAAFDQEGGYNRGWIIIDYEA